MKVVTNKSSGVDHAIAAALRAHQHNLLHVKSPPANEPYTIMDSGAQQAYMGQGWAVINVHADRIVTDRKKRRVHLVDCVATYVELNKG